MYKVELESQYFLFNFFTDFGALLKKGNIKFDIKNSYTIFII